MSAPGFLFTAKLPAECSQRELADFERLVKEGGEVTGSGLADGIRRAIALVFMTAAGKLHGIAGVKSPAASYRAKVSAKSGYSLPVATLPYELGWVYIIAQSQGKKLCRPLVQRAITAANGAGLFATSRVGKDAMHHVLITEGFMKSGKPYSAANGSANLLLFVRNSTGSPAAPERDIHGQSSRIHAP